MDAMKSYLIGVIAAAIVCGIVTRLLGDKGTQGAMAKLLSGLFLVFTVIRPIVNIDLRNLTDFTSFYSNAGQQAAAAGECLTKDAMAASIKAQSEAYILDKAAALDVELDVEIRLSDEDIPVPVSIRLSGKVSPYAKARLQNIITEDLGIDKECQTWT